MRILIAHEWALVRAGIRQILTDEFGFLDVTQMSTALEDIDLASGPWDLAVVGIDTLDNRGLHLIQALKRAYPQHRVIAVSSQNLTHFEGALKHFIEASLTIDSQADEVVRAVRHATNSAGQNTFKASAGLSKTPELSNREVEVLRLLATGKNIKAIAAALNVSPSSVSTYRVRMFRKLQMKSTGELIRYALRNHIAD